MQVDGSESSSSKQAAIVAVQEGLRTRTIDSKTMRGYKSNLRTLQRVILKNPSLFHDPFMTEMQDGVSVIREHPVWSGIYRWSMPISLSNAKSLFALVSCDGSLTKRKPKESVLEAFEEVEEEVEEAIVDDDLSNPARNFATMAQWVICIQLSSGTTNWNVWKLINCRFHFLTKFEQKSISTWIRTSGMLEKRGEEG